MRAGTEYKVTTERPSLSLSVTELDAGSWVLPTLGGNICMGDWRAVDENHVSRSHVGWLFSDGNPSGYFTQTETDEVARDGSWYRGTNYIRLYDLNGVQFAEGAGTAEATRIPAP